MPLSPERSYLWRSLTGVPTVAPFYDVLTMTAEKAKQSILMEETSYTYPGPLTCFYLFGCCFFRAVVVPRAFFLACSCALVNFIVLLPHAI